jgi:hypothetical protein
MRHSYGEKGGAIITSTIHRLFGPGTAMREAIKPLQFTVFCDYVLVPFVGHLLIAEDLGCSARKAFAIMHASGDTGDTLHPLLDENDEVDEIHARNMRLARKERASVCTDSVYMH